MLSTSAQRMSLVSLLFVSLLLGSPAIAIEIDGMAAATEGMAGARNVVDCSDFWIVPEEFHYYYPDGVYVTSGGACTSSDYCLQAAVYDGCGKYVGCYVKMCTQFVIDEAEGYPKFEPDTSEAKCNSDNLPFFFTQSTQSCSPGGSLTPSTKPVPTKTGGGSGLVD